MFAKTAERWRTTRLATRLVLVRSQSASDRDPDLQVLLL